MRARGPPGPGPPRPTPRRRAHRQRHAPRPAARDTRAVTCAIPPDARTTRRRPGAVGAKRGGLCAGCVSRLRRGGAASPSRQGLPFRAAMWWRKPRTVPFVVKALVPPSLPMPTLSVVPSFRRCWLLVAPASEEAPGRELQRFAALSATDGREWDAAPARHVAL